MAPNQQPGALESLTDNQGSRGPLTHNQRAPGRLTNNQGGQGLPIDNQGAPEPITGNQGASGSLTDNQGSQTRSPLTQIFNNLYAKYSCEKSKSFDLKVATPGPCLTLL